MSFDSAYGEMGFGGDDSSRGNDVGFPQTEQLDANMNLSIFSSALARNKFKVPPTLTSNVSCGCSMEKGTS